MSVKEYLSFNKRERRGLLALSFILFALILFNLSIPYLFKNLPIDQSKQIAEIESYLLENNKSSYSPIEKLLIDSSTPPKQAIIRAFNPNTVNKNTLQELNLSERVISNWLKFIERGGKFRSREDLLKIYGLKEDSYKLLEPYIEIPKVATGFGTDHKIEINAADSAQLISIKGIGPYFSSKIISYRNKLGGFYSLYQLKEIKGIDSEKLISLQQNLSINTSLINQINVNTCEWDDLKNHPYLNYYQSKAILNYRKNNGNFQSILDLKHIDLVTDSIFEKITPYLIVGP